MSAERHRDVEFTQTLHGPPILAPVAPRQVVDQGAVVDGIPTEQDAAPLVQKRDGAERMTRQVKDTVGHVPEVDPGAFGQHFGEWRRGDRVVPLVPAATGNIGNGIRLPAEEIG